MCQSLWNIHQQVSKSQHHVSEYFFTVEENLAVEGNLTVEASFTVEDSLAVEGCLAVEGSFTVKTSLTDEGFFTVEGCLTVEYSLSVQGIFTVEGSFTVKILFVCSEYKASQAQLWPKPLPGVGNFFHKCIKLCGKE